MGTITKDKGYKMVQVTKRYVTEPMEIRMHNVNKHFDY